MKYATSDIVMTYEPYKPITKLIVQIDKGVQIANAANNPFTIAQIIAKEYPLVFKNGLYRK